MNFPKWELFSGSPGMLKIPSRDILSYSAAYPALELLQVSLLINKQTGGKKKKKKEGKGEGEGERDLWTTRFENEARHSLAQV